MIKINYKEVTVEKILQTINKYCLHNYVTVAEQIHKLYTGNEKEIESIEIDIPHYKHRIYIYKEHENEIDFGIEKMNEENEAYGMSFTKEEAKELANNILKMCGE